MRKLLLILAFATAAYGQKPETVISNFYPKPGKEEELLKVLRAEWSVYTRLGLVSGEHHLYRAETEGGSVFFIQIFTWKDENIPDNAPAEVKKVWADLRANTAKIDFAAVTPVSDAESSPPAAGPSR